MCCLGGHWNFSFNYYDLEDYNEGDDETSEDYFTGDNDYGDRDVYDDQEIDAYDDDPGGDYSIVEGEEEEIDYEDEDEDEEGGDYTIDEDGEVVVEESQLTETTFNRTVRITQTLINQIKLSTMFCKKNESKNEELVPIS